MVAQPSTVTVTEDSDSANNATDSSRHREQVRAQGAASQGAAHRGVSSPQDSADESPQEPVDDRDVASFSAGDGSFYGRRAGRETSSPERGTAGSTPEPREERRFGGQENRQAPASEAPSAHPAVKAQAAPRTQVPRQGRACVSAPSTG